MVSYADIHVRCMADRPGLSDSCAACADAARIGRRDPDTRARHSIRDRDWCHERLRPPGRVRFLSSLDAGHHARAAPGCLRSMAARVERSASLGNMSAEPLQIRSVSSGCRLYVIEPMAVAAGLSADAWKSVENSTAP